MTVAKLKGARDRIAKLKGARDRTRRERGKCEGRNSYAEREGGAELVDMARWLHRNADGRPYSLREVATELAGYGYVTPSGRPRRRLLPRCLTEPRILTA